MGLWKGSPPLTGIKVLELAGLAPGPYAGMMLADAGASVLRIDRPDSTSTDLLTRRKASIGVNLKSRGGVALVRRLASRVDVLIDPFRPGVLEKLGLGPDELLGSNERLIYARMSGFRRDGRYSAMAGHDINYLAVSGVLGLLGRPDGTPLPPANMLADFAGGGATLVHGILLALFARHNSGRGQVVEANMVDGASYLATFPRFMLKTPLGSRGRGRNLLDGGCPYYDTYATSDGRFMSVGALEPQFFAILIERLGLEGQDWETRRHDVDQWPKLRQLLEETFQTKTRSEWERVFDGCDACCLPVLDYGELETDAAREGDQRPAVTLRQTPCLGFDQAAQGQGSAGARDGYHGETLAAGQGGDQVLASWFGWQRGRDYHVQEGEFCLDQEASTKL
ncbi:hypothetical protein CDD82_3487 [Ophiocordyceps australis]|uniref:Alpha-methylacyl-CoA racemase n=1 Tax=Ophiocordyceps australis TaxID=1399860 RepID=A0A2C5ZBV1_9HYPO|nr:hypothetical protein CDD82_3487 [Ophiocordyceps australis]